MNGSSSMCILFVEKVLDIYATSSVTASSQSLDFNHIWKAVDRFTTTADVTSYISLRDRSPDDYWRLELMEFATISLVKISSVRNKGRRGDLLKTTAYIGNTTTNRGEDNTACGTISSTAEIVIYIQCVNPIVGKYVYLVAVRQLRLDEVEFYKPGFIKHYCYVLFVIYYFDALGLPIIKSQPQWQQVTPDSNISFVCSADGTPLPSITWKHGMTAASGAVSQSVSNAFTMTSMLTLTSVERSRSGNYTCEVTNSEGTRSAVAFLAVLCEYFCITSSSLCLFNTLF